VFPAPRYQIAPAGSSRPSHREGNSVGGSFARKLAPKRARNIVFMFMSSAALAAFEKSSGWQAGATAGVALAKTGAENSVDTKQVNAPVLAFVFGNTGLMADASVEGTKISKLE
jgi:lipid-binding SYLF domain-containing protein